MDFKKCSLLLCAKILSDALAIHPASYRIVFQCEFVVSFRFQRRKALKRLAFLLDGFHRREKQNVANGGGIGEEHDQAVDANANA